MIKESIQYTIQLIEDIQKVEPTAYQEYNYELDILVQHMRIVKAHLDKDKKAAWPLSCLYGAAYLTV